MKSVTPDLLLVEDNADDAELTLRALRRAVPGALVERVSDGVEALDYLVDRLPRVLLLDLKLTRLHGEEVVRRIKGDPKLRHLPVVVLSSSQEPADVRKCFELGVNSFVVKPLDPDAFASVVGAVTTYWLTMNQSPV